jgi:AcrR family transcriptional regulator
VSEPAPSPARATKQARSERTLQRILDAAEALILEKGLPDVSVPDIVARAGSSVGGFYARFRDKNALLHALEERFFARLSDRVEQLAEPGHWGDADLAAIAAGLVAELVHTIERERSLIEAIIFRSASDRAFRNDGLAFRQRVSERVSHLLLLHADEIGHPEPRVAIDLGIQAAFAMMIQHVVFGGTAAGGRRLDDARLERELCRLCLGYLGARPKGAPAS